MIKDTNFVGFTPGSFMSWYIINHSLFPGGRNTGNYPGMTEISLFRTVQLYKSYNFRLSLVHLPERECAIGN